MRRKGSVKTLEDRRRKAVELVSRGHSTARVAEKLRAHRRSVARWVREYRKGGMQALTAKPTRGRPRKLTQLMMIRLKELLTAGPHALGFNFDQWTHRRIALLIQREFGVIYHTRHIGKFLRKL